MNRREREKEKERKFERKELKKRDEKTKRQREIFSFKRLDKQQSQNMKRLKKK